jgi:hypothetical protein
LGYFRIFGLNSKNDVLTLSDFLIGVGQLKFRGTSVLFRLNKAISDLINAIQLEQDKSNSSGNNKKLTNGLNNQAGDNEQQQQTAAKDGLYELAMHTVKVKRSGTVADISTLWDLEGATTPLLGKDNILSMAFDFSKPQFGRIHSFDVFNQKTQPNEMLNGLRYYERAIKEVVDKASNQTVVTKVRTRLSVRYALINVK